MSRSQFIFTFVSCPFSLFSFSFKLKLRNQVTTEQEKLLGEKSQEMEEIRKELESAKSTLRQKTEEVRKIRNVKSSNYYLETVVHRTVKAILSSDEICVDFIVAWMNDTPLLKVCHFEMWGFFSFQ